ncbi:Protein of unknown function [Marisediminitalea aggregata]|uniref:DUF445 domain-containing protein n=1 Tax=Marisediminitalea aggregata TaxID=634436 RepID=A0A1M5JPI6_9ALTE|nr:DUF445 family protein [Marisediminitalea aggregata]MBL54111.1 DUF445 domain-containing protein [Alteromonadaceae bacterium]MCP5010453.1 DUF445 family protein [Aestuariibacter sp.]MEC7471579.1 DUF445 family protein [Pseudomonadota bacterium]MEC7825614.1 DUF445 family protein [Pseudomonadota bacterium]SHG42477.1 Protein of unknown function [Marisediminitalea aggregata]|tara:strand:+ start:3236 stop:4447 length:1212 start_codon:yes stop_codon:yes gene_type:complete
MDWNLQTLSLLSIPLISALVGWSTNYLAVKMMFYPLKFVGIPPVFGWQGLIPAKRKQMAEIEVELVLGKLLSVEELANRLEPEALTKAIEHRLHQVVRKIVNEVMESSAPTVWAALPVQGKNLVYRRIEDDIPYVVSKMVEDFQHNVNEILDIKELVVEQLVNSPELINEIFLRSGEKEFPFIVQSGFYFGFLFGLPTMALWYFYQAWWILPLGGLLVGYATNWIAIKIIFEPKQPIRFAGLTIQGMFLKRQTEVSRVYADIIEQKLINPKNITHMILHGSGSAQLLELIELHVNDAIERYVAIAQPYFALGVGSENYFKMKSMAVKRLFEDSDKYLYYAFDYANEALRVGDDLCERMQALSSEEFEGVLRPAYQQDEWKLIVTGAILGMAAGFAQLYLLMLG